MIVGTDSQVDEMEESIRENIDPNLKIKDIKVESKSQNHYLTHYRYIGNRSSFRPEEIYAVSLEIEKSIGYVKEYIDMFIYPCDGEKSCFTTIFLMSPRDKSDRNLPTFQKLSDSFLGHDNSSP